MIGGGIFVSFYCVHRHSDHLPLGSKSQPFFYSVAKDVRDVSINYSSVRINDAILLLSLSLSSRCFGLFFGLSTILIIYATFFIFYFVADFFLQAKIFASECKLTKYVCECECV